MINKSFGSIPEAKKSNGLVKPLPLMQICSSKCALKIFERFKPNTRCLCCGCCHRLFFGITFIWCAFYWIYYGYLWLYVYYSNTFIMHMWTNFNVIINEMNEATSQSKIATISNYNNKPFCISFCSTVFIFSI